MKQLSSLLESLQQRRPIKPTTLPFYLRSKDEKDLKAGKFTLVKIQLNERDVKKAILSILKTCNLSTTFLDKIQEPVVDKSKFPYHHDPRVERDGINFSQYEDDPFYMSILMKRKINAEPDTFK